MPDEKEAINLSSIILSCLFIFLSFSFLLSASAVSLRFNYPFLIPQAALVLFAADFLKLPGLRATAADVLFGGVAGDDFVEHGLLVGAFA